MNFLTAPLTELGVYEDLNNALKKPGVTEVEGCVDSEKVNLIASLGEEAKYRVIVTTDDTRAREILSDLRVYDSNAVYYPARDLIFYQSDLNGNQLIKDRMAAIRAMLEEKKVTVVTTFDAFMEKIPGLELIRNHVLEIDDESELETEQLSHDLTTMGYTRTVQVESEGQFAVRGGIVDIWPLTEENPIRMELWGEEVTDIRSFDAVSQRSIEEVPWFRVYPATELVLTSEERDAGLDAMQKEFDVRYKALRKDMKTEEAYRLKSTIGEFREELLNSPGSVSTAGYVNYFFKSLHSFLDFFKPDETVMFLDEPVHLIEKADAIMKEFSESMTARLEKGYTLSGAADLLYDKKEIFARITARPTLALATIIQRQDQYKPETRISVSARPVNSYNGSFESLVEDLKKYRKNHYRIVILSASVTRAKRLADNLNENDIPAFFSDDHERELKPAEVMTAYGSVRQGFEYPDIRFCVMSETDIFGGIRKKKRKRHTYEGERIASFTDLAVGDYVIHENYGIGQYQGIEHLDIDGVTRDYVKINYKDNSSVYVIASNLDALQKYASRDAEKKPKLNKLGTQEWSKTKARVHKSVEGVAKKLVALYAARQNGKGFVCGPDTVWQREFEEMFPFEETEDQIMAIEAVKHDMESTKIMDRLICGDVGFGKTEIAIRAAFKAVQENKQVAILVPTTILAEQHYNTFRQRLKNYPVRIDLLCRFRTSAEQKKTIADLKKGQVDIVVGTHRLLSKDVAFKDLGLLVIDEEQRFGVTHKEKIKELRQNVDVLALTATPIPRTLHMSLVGIRDMSVLEEAPQDRMPIQTFIMEYSDEMVREAVSRELARGGQVYYVYNRVNDIAQVAADLQAMLPDATVAFAHGQMRERELEDIMSDFINGEIDVLVSTTIIETGLDISNANTMIIHDADRMGLSQLYQLRGRVGRSTRTAYAFLMYRRNKLLKETAEKRLAAIREFTELGSGFRIAMKDLEIRGSGNVLGAEQSGHMEEVGYDLYCKMLDTAVKEEKGEKVLPEFTTTVDMDEDAFIPETYVRNENQKLDLYKRIAVIETHEEAEDMIQELKDRFGKPPKSVLNLIEIALVRQKAHKVFIENLSAKENTIMFNVFAKAELNPVNIPELLDQYSGGLTFRAVGKPIFTYKFGKNEERDYIKAANDVLDHMRILLDESDADEGTH
ncbi:transcription-repair coupling factor [Lachnospiraceae bacterium]|nr:transcription-repair coupling factor [Lachnospiraceae bacterium]